MAINKAINEATRQALTPLQQERLNFRHAGPRLLCIQKREELLDLRSVWRLADPENMRLSSAGVQLFYRVSQVSSFSGGSRGVHASSCSSSSSTKVTPSVGWRFLQKVVNPAQIDSKPTPRRGNCSSELGDRAT